MPKFLFFKGNCSLWLLNWLIAKGVSTAHSSDLILRHVPVNPCKSYEKKFPFHSQSVNDSVSNGFKADAAQKIVMQTMNGAVKLLQTSGLHPEQAIDLVCTPGGVTIKGLNEMEHAGFTSAVIRGLKAGVK